MTKDEAFKQAAELTWLYGEPHYVILKDGDYAVSPTSCKAAKRYATHITEIGGGNK